MPARSISPSGRRVVTRTGDAPRNDAGPASLLAKLDVALDNMPGALIYTDDQLNIIFCNRRFREMYSAPAELLQPGRPYPDLLRFLADNGYYGDGDRAGLVAPRIDSLRNPSGRSFEDRTSDGRTYRVLRRRVDAGGVVTVMTDITDQKLAEQATARREAQFHVALDNMPGALVYTDADLNIVFCNDRFREMYPAPPELLQSGSPYPAFLYCLADNGYYGQGDRDALASPRVERLRNPSDRSFEDRTPDGRFYRILRRRVSAGGVVTVMTDIGDQKLAERKTAEKEAQFHLALDNMPGALVYTDADLDIVFCNDRFREMYPAPAELLQSGRPYPGFLRWLAENGYYGPGDRDALVARRVESLRNPSDRSFEDRTPDNRFYRIMRRRVDGDGAVTVMTDITDQKQAEQQLLEEKDRTEQANDQVTEKNRMLEGLSSKLSKDAKACVRMALAMQRRVRDLEYEWRSRGLERPFRIRMGICTGFCTVGNFGSQDRMDYTIIGNEVNLAARLQTLAEPGGILLSHETNALVSDIVLCEEQPPITVKGFVRPVNTYKVVGTYDDLVETGRVVLKERDGLRVLVDLARQSRPEAIAILEEILTQLKN